ncbi:hypothetical protein F5J12DRAFT_786240 [Pisolithus orientalis]|uniref:uncharacterized protein n=1 Tax=Pisolithus orientalis TaxID=936130 RepID=UPI002224F0C0|nr:uncharacterized protein F5J12DRAFT_786240 [Pisolithus orientalis]KAI5992008.1 hypothetical protein F5J12DRAFT_786240 [Pisolithus orientalis]
MTSPSAPATVTATCHPDFYFENGMYIILVENFLYKLNHDILVNESAFFSDLFSLGKFMPEDKDREGHTDQKPIIVKDRFLTTEIFDLFLEIKFMCPHPPAKYSADDLKNLLEFIHKFQCSACLLSFITSCIIEKSYSFHPSELIYLGIEYKIWVLFERGFMRLCNLPLTKTKKIHHHWMGMETYITYVYVRSHLDEYVHTVAVEAPPIVHATCCQDHKGCEEDWGVVWWNSMGQLFLNGRSPYSFNNAIDLFKKLQFGCIGKDCKRNAVAHHIN